MLTRGGVVEQSKRKRWIQKGPERWTKGGTEKQSTTHCTVYTAVVPISFLILFYFIMTRFKPPNHPCPLSHRSWPVCMKSARSV